MSLSSTLRKYLERNNYLSYTELEWICRKEQRKISNGERRLKDVEPIKERCESGVLAIVGYRIIKNKQTQMI